MQILKFARKIWRDLSVDGRGGIDVRVLGVDPGMAITGYAVVSEVDQTLTLYRYGVIRTPSSMPLPRRLYQIHKGISDLLDEYQPRAVSVERLFFNKNVRTAMTVGQARGVVLLAAGARDLPVLEYTPPQVKAAVTGHGAATKEQVQLMVQSLLRLVEIPTPDDAADAIAVAVCSLHRWGWDEKLGAGR